jgi:DNA ligase-1
MSWQRWSGIMKAYPFEESRLAKWQPPYIVQPKYDGDRCKSYPIQGGNYLCLTSEENPFFSIPHIYRSLAQSGLRFNLDGELYSHHLNLEGGHELIHSIASRKTNLHPRHKELEYHIFDIESEEPQPLRLKAVQKIGELNLPYIKVAPYWICSTINDIKKVYDNLIVKGYEGIIIRYLYNVYERKRSTFVMKLKPKRTDQYKIVGFNEEISKDGIPKNRLGSVICSSQSGDTFSVSAGLNDIDKEYYWSIRDTLIGKDCIISYQHLTNKKIPKGSFDLKIKE